MLSFFIVSDVFLKVCFVKQIDKTESQQDVKRHMKPFIILQEIRTGFSRPFIKFVTVLKKFKKKLKFIKLFYEVGCLSSRTENKRYYTLNRERKKL